MATWAQNVLPESWHGTWSGRLNIFSSAGKTMELGMKIVIEPLDSSHQVSWTLAYLPDDTTEMKNDIRPYELIGQKDRPGHFVVDEKNSILLDCYLLDQVLTSRFRVDQALLMINYTHLGDSLRFEVFSGAMEPVRQTGAEVEEVEIIEAFGIGNYQRAILYPQED